MGTFQKIITISGFMVLLLAGCGTANEQMEKENINGDTSTEQTTKPEQEEKLDDPEINEGIVRILEQNLTYTVNNEQKVGTAFLKYDDAQSYSMYVLPEYELSAEEPNKDVILFTADDSFFMRIELFPSEVDWTTIKDTTKSQLAAVNSEVRNIEPPNEEFFANATAMEATQNGDIVTAYLINTSNLKFKLTMFTKTDADHRNAFIEMAKTIIQEKAE
jgi:hypothetical protein